MAFEELGQLTGLRYESTGETLENCHLGDDGRALGQESLWFQSTHGVEQEEEHCPGNTGKGDVRNDQEQRQCQFGALELLHFPGGVKLLQIFIVS